MEHYAEFPTKIFLQPRVNIGQSLPFFNCKDIPKIQTTEITQNQHRLKTNHPNSLFLDNIRTFYSDLKFVLFGRRVLRR